jgi:hypothetical protein
MPSSYRARISVSREREFAGRDLVGGGGDVDCLVVDGAVLVVFHLGNHFAFVWFPPSSDFLFNAEGK